MANYYTYVNANGVVVPDTSTILTGVQNEYKAVFGADLVVTADTPQGVLITAEALARDDVSTNNAALANQINPNVAGGTFLDAIMALLGLQRTAATRSVVSGALLTGVPTTVISVGTQAKTAAGDVFQTINSVTLNAGGTATVDFQSVQYGAIPCTASSLTILVTNVLGWETVTNPNAAILGTTTQSDQAARALRNNTLAFQGVALPVAITSALYNVAGVRSLFFQENVADTTQTINGISMISHSIYACIDGGANTDIGAALLENKSSGCAWNGGTSVTVTEPASGQAYTVNFDRPTPRGILIKVTTTNGSTTDIQNAVLAYAAGTVDGIAGFTVSSDVSPFEISAAIVNQFPAYFIKKVEISYDTVVSYTTDTLAIAVNEIAFTNVSYITVVIAP